MSTFHRFTDHEIHLAKQANLIDYMESEHPDRIFCQNGQVRDRKHDSLVLFPRDYFRFSLAEAGDSISYLTKYQDYSWRDAVCSLMEFSLEQPVTHKFQKCSSDPASELYDFRVPPDSGLDTGFLCNYLTFDCNISRRLSRNLIYMQKIYPSKIPGQGVRYICFANPGQDYYWMKNTRKRGVQEILYAKTQTCFWWFSSDIFLPIGQVFSMMDNEYTDTYEDCYPLYICNSPLDAVSLYDLTKEHGIYIALSSLDIENLDYAIRCFSRYLAKPRQVILALPRTADTAFISNRNYPKIFPDGNSWTEMLQNTPRSPESLHEVDCNGGTEYECFILNRKGEILSFTDYTKSKNGPLIDMESLLEKHD